LPPVHLSVVSEGEKEPALILELENEVPDAPCLLRVSGSPFTDENTTEALAKNGRKRLVIACFATEVVVFHTARDAIKAGYKVQVPVDACGGMSTRTEEAIFRRIEAAGGVTTCVVTLA
jgi:nicotinamidase-related amidase